MAYGSALAQMPGRTSHGMQIPPGYASVGLEEVHPDYNDLELEIPGGDGEKTLKDAIHGIILWPKRYIIIPEASVPLIDPQQAPSTGLSLAPGSSSHHAHEQAPASGLNAHEQALAVMPTEDLVNVIKFQEETGLPLDALLGNADPPSPDRNIVPRWPFKLGQPLVRPELVKKLTTKMNRFHQWYMKVSARDREMFGMLVRPDDFSGEEEKAIWLKFQDIYEIYHLDALNTDLIVVWCL